MSCEEYIDETFNELMITIKQHRDSLKKAFDGKDCGDFAEINLEDKQAREKVLAEAIRKAVLKLEGTKKSFKSKVLKEVREDLLKVVENY